MYLAHRVKRVLRDPWALRVCKETQESKVEKHFRDISLKLDNYLDWQLNNPKRDLSNHPATLFIFPLRNGITTEIRREQLLLSQLDYGSEEACKWQNQDNGSTN